MLKRFSFFLITMVLFIKPGFSMEADFDHLPSVVKRTIKVGPKKIDITNYCDITGAGVLHQKGITGAGTKVIVIDSYIDPTQKAFVNNLSNSIIPGKYNKQKMNLGHGTHITGIIQDMAPDTEIKFLSNFDNLGKFTTNSICAALEEAANSKGDAVNLSFTLMKKKMEAQLNYEPYADVGPDIEASLKKIVDSGKVVFIALGNEYDSNQFAANTYAKKLIALASKPEMKGMLVLVASSEYDNHGKERLASYSNRSVCDTPYVIMAPGSNILSAMPGDQYASLSGTSMATPVVVASYLLLKSALPGLEPWQYLELIRITARKESLNKSYLFNDQYGNGVIRINKAFEEGLKKFKGNRNFVEGPESIHEWTFIEREEDKVMKSPIIQETSLLTQNIEKEEKSEHLISNVIKTVNHWAVAPLENLTKLWN